jgi:hypothetical protein
MPGLLPKEPPPDSPASKMTGTNGPVLLGEDDAAQPVDKRKVKYWITMSLPTFWTPRPPGAKPGEIYLYRPDFYQDQDGIERRITLWFNPMTRTSLQDILAGSKLGGKSTPGGSATPATQATPAVPVAPEEPTPPSHNPFRSPFDDTYHGSTGSRSGDSTKNPAAPSGTNGNNAPIPPPLTNTNAPPANTD